MRVGALSCPFGTKMYSVVVRHNIFYARRGIGLYRMIYFVREQCIHCRKNRFLWYESKTL